jgi:acyl-CoA thioester hydrolase
VHERIQWADTDASGHYHFGTAFRLFEAAEARLLDGLGLLKKTAGRFPRVHASADFKRVLHYDDLVEVVLTVDGVGRSSVRYRFEVRHEGVVCVEGEAAAVLLTDSEGDTAAWSPEERELLLTSGPLPG